MMRCRGCGHRYPRQTYATGGDIPKRQLTLAELMEPPRLVDLVARRPDIADLPLIGARLGRGIGENA